MTTHWKVKVTDDYGVCALLTFTGFTAEQIDMAILQYDNAVSMVDIGAFVKWFRDGYVDTRTKQSIEVSYV